MKPIKMLGLAALAALMAMAFVGASSAMATTQLCKVDESLCAAGNAVTHLHEETLWGSPALLLNGLGNVLCTVLFLSTWIDPLQLFQRTLGNFTYTNCVKHKIFGGTEGCTVTELNEPAEITVVKGSHETAFVLLRGEVLALCGKSLHCVYNSEGLEATAKGPLLSTETNGEVTLSEQTMNKVSGTLCPKTAKLDIKVTPLPDPVYIST